MNCQKRQLPNNQTITKLLRDGIYAAVAPKKAALTWPLRLVFDASTEKANVMKEIDTRSTLPIATALVMLCSMLVVAHGAPQNLSGDYDAKTDFTRYKTYAWVDCKRPANSKLNHDAVIVKINHHLAAIGLRRVDEQQADLYVSYRGGIEDCVTYDVDSFSYGGTIERKHQEASIAIELIEVKTKNLVWVGRAVYTLSDNTGNNDRRIDQTILKILKKYPPTKGTK